MLYSLTLEDYPNVKLLISSKDFMDCMKILKDLRSEFRDINIQDIDKLRKNDRSITIEELENLLKD